MTVAALPDPRDDAAGDPSLLKDCGYRTALIGKWRHGISDATHYKWKSKYGGMEASDLKWVKDLEAQATSFEPGLMSYADYVNSAARSMPGLGCRSAFSGKRISAVKA